jgi:hypothetical protein
LSENNYWEFTQQSNAAATVNSSGTNLPNVYVFDGNKQRYYNDDDNLGTYTVYSTDYTEDAQVQNLSFTYYQNDSDPTDTVELSGTYSVEGTVLKITATNHGDFTAADRSSTDGVKDAVTQANELAGINQYTDDFESYSPGTMISSANSDWQTSNIESDPTLGTTKAEVSDTLASGGTQSLYLEDSHSGTKPFAMREFAAPATSGSVSLDVYFPSSNQKSTYINIGDGKNNANRYFELNQSGSNLKYEAGTDDVLLKGDIARDTWHSLTISWTDAGYITVTMNGEVLLADIDQTSTGLDSSIVPSQLTLYTGDNSGVSNSAYFDNLNSDLF